MHYWWVGHAEILVDSVGGQQTSALNILGSASFLNSTFQTISINNGRDFAVLFVDQRGKLMLRDTRFVGNAARFDVGKYKNGLVRSLAADIVLDVLLWLLSGLVHLAACKRCLQPTMPCYDLGLCPVEHYCTLTHS